jgi:hypothetical protein
MARVCRNGTGLGISDHAQWVAQCAPPLALRRQGAPRQFKQNNGCVHTQMFMASEEAMVRFAALIAALLVCGAAAARDVGQITSNSDPKTSAWFRGAKSPGGTSCCDEADGYREGVAVRMPLGEPTVIFRSWWAASNGYHLSLLDPRDLTPNRTRLGRSGRSQQPHSWRSRLALVGERNPVGAMLLTWPTKLSRSSGRDCRNKLCSSYDYQWRPRGR